MYTFREHSKNSCSIQYPSEMHVFRLKCINCKCSMIVWNENHFFKVKYNQDTWQMIEKVMV